MTKSDNPDYQVSLSMSSKLDEIKVYLAYKKLEGW